METGMRALLLCLGLAVFSFAGGKSVSMPLPATISDSLPWFAVREVGNQTQPFTKSHLAKLVEKEKRVALVYFATWCLPCRAGVKKLAASESLLEQNHVKVVLVNIGEREDDKIQEWLEKTGAKNFKAIGDPFRRLTEGFGMIKEGEELSLPRTIVLDKNLKPLFMLGEEGTDWPSVLWSK